MVSALGLKRIALIAFLSVLTVPVANVVYSAEPDMGWLLLLIITVLIFLQPLLDLFNLLTVLQPSSKRVKTTRETLDEILTSLPSQEALILYKLKELLLHRVAARACLTVSEAEAKARELVKDEELRLLIEGKLKLSSPEHVMDLLDRIDKL